MSALGKRKSDDISAVDEPPLNAVSTVVPMDMTNAKDEKARDELIDVDATVDAIIDVATGKFRNPEAVRGKAHKMKHQHDAVKKIMQGSKFAGDAQTGKTMKINKFMCGTTGPWAGMFRKRVVDAAGHWRTVKKNGLTGAKGSEYKVVFPPGRRWYRDVAQYSAKGERPNEIIKRAREILLFECSGWAVSERVSDGPGVPWLVHFISNDGIVIFETLEKQRHRLFKYRQDLLLHAYGEKKVNGRWSQRQLIRSLNLHMVIGNREHMIELPLVSPCSAANWVKTNTKPDQLTQCYDKIMRCQKRAPEQKRVLVPKSGLKQVARQFGRENYIRNHLYKIFPYAPLNLPEWQEFDYTQPYEEIERQLKAIGRWPPPTFKEYLKFDLELYRKHRDAARAAAEKKADADEEGVNE
eukprot:TRINITY_DN103579_c0_g1_i1.p1 TRINITY_DN103579_c0_g1~~TRINITY_DN103579_c0_g1_i1.p1  ORF type:complete len:410 (+),score=155.54 TRINITY_DN103579_c0_g1_i1:62-1291(+)